MATLTQQIQGLVGEIHTSRRARVQSIADLKSETAQLLDEFRVMDQERAVVTRQRAEDVAASREDVRDQNRERATQIKAFRDEIRSDHQEAAQVWLSR